ncbi:DNA ligase [Shewanella sp.]|uniref:DNA ligase n=1 Tax=Shewanella sp. TaxID=50422 RepID=UPI0035613C76
MKPSSHACPMRSHGGIQTRFTLSNAFFTYLHAEAACFAAAAYAAALLWALLTLGVLYSNTAMASADENQLSATSQAPLQLASSIALPVEEELGRYWVSEKLDGIRGRWTGRELITRSGNHIAVPAWFIADFPQDLVLDGELWGGRGQFEWTSGVVRSSGREQDWHELRFMVFDSPMAGMSFSERLSKLQQRLPNTSPYIALIAQQRFKRQAELLAFFETEVAAGAEGLMLHREDAHYRDGRNSLLIKLKPLNDAEGEVIGYKPGQGELSGLMGSLKLRLKDGRVFYLGSGFDLATRRDPPAIGTWVTFQFQGLSARGIPKGARFLRVRPAE